MKRIALALLLSTLAFPAFAADNLAVTPGSGATIRMRDTTGAGGPLSSYVILGDLAGVSILGTAGTANANIISVQGIASMTPLLINPGTAATWGILTQGSTTSGQSGSLSMGAVTTGAPTYTTGQTSPISLDTAGNVRVVQVGGGGAVTVADGADTAEGAKADAACATDTGTCSVIALLKRNNQNVAAPAAVTGAAAAFVDGWDLTQGAKADAVCGTATGTCSEIALTKFIASSVSSPVPAGTNTIGGVIPTAAATGGAFYTFAIAPTTPAGVNIKNTTGNVYSVQLGNIQATPAYLKLYDTSAVPTCGSGTPAAVFIIPAASTAANGGGSNISFPVGKHFSNGIAYCVTGGLPNADTTALTANSVTINIDWF